MLRCITRVGLVAILAFVAVQPSLWLSFMSVGPFSLFLPLSRIPLRPSAAETALLTHPKQKKKMYSYSWQLWSETTAVRLYQHSCLAPSDTAWLPAAGKPPTSTCYHCRLSQFLLSSPVSVPTDQRSPAPKSNSGSEAFSLLVFHYCHPPDLIHAFNICKLRHTFIRFELTLTWPYVEMHRTSSALVLRMLLCCGFLKGWVTDESLSGIYVSGSDRRWTDSE